MTTCEVCNQETNRPHAHICIRCYSKRYREWNRERINEYAHSEKYRESRRIYWLKNKERLYKRYEKKRIKNYLTKMLGLIPDIYLFRKGISTDGCTMENTVFLKGVKTLTKRVNLYGFNGIGFVENTFKIQFYDSIYDRELWINFSGTRMQAMAFIGNLIKVYASTLFKWIELKDVEV